MILERHAEAMDVDATMTNVANPGVICSPVDGYVNGGLRAARNKAEVTVVTLEFDLEIILIAVALVVGGEVFAGNKPGTRNARMEDMQATMNDTTVAWTCSKVKFPMIIERRVTGSSSSPTLAAVPRRAERFISRLPLRLSTAGIIIISCCTSRMARQRCN